MIRPKRFVWILLAIAVLLLMGGGVIWGIRVRQFHAAVALFEAADVTVYLSESDDVPFLSPQFQRSIGLSRVILTCHVDPFGPTTPISELGPAWQRLVPQLKRFECLQFSLTDDDVRVLEGAPELTSLAFNGEQLTDAGVAGIARAGRLTSLTLVAPHMTDRGFEALVPCRHMSILILLNTQLTGASLKYITRFPGLTQLSLPGAKIQTADLEHLTHLIHLRDLVLSQTLLDDHAAPFLERMIRLESISLSRTEVGDNVCEALTKLPLLQSVSLRQTRVTADGLLKLRAARPDLLIAHDVAGVP